MRTSSSPTPAGSGTAPAFRGGASFQARALGTLLAALTPLLAMLAAGSAFSRSLEPDLVTGAALGLGLAQAPGAPLAALLAHAMTWLPLGPLPARLVFASSIAAAIAAGALYRGVDVSSPAHARRPAIYTSAPLALACVLVAFSCDPLFFVDARAHAVGIAIACLCLERLATTTAAAPSDAARGLRSAAFWLGLLLIEQPALALCVWFAARPAVQHVRQAQPSARWIGIAIGAACPLAIGLIVLGARDPQRAEYALSSSAQLWRGAFQRAGGDLGARFAGFSLTGWILIGGAALAGVRALRAPAAHRHITPWLAVMLAALVGSALLTHAAALRALALCGAAAAVALTLTDFFEAGLPRRLAFSVAVLTVALGGVRLRATALRQLESDARIVDALRDPLLRALPPRSATLVEPDVARMLRDAELEERVRPDVLVAIKPWRLDLSASEALARRAPELQPALRAQLLQGELPVSELQTLAAHRPVLIELSATDEQSLIPALLPWALYHQVSTSTATRSDVRFAAREADTRLALLPSVLEADPPDDLARGLLSDLARAASDYYEHVGDREHAASARALADSLTRAPP